MDRENTYCGQLWVRHMFLHQVIYAPYQNDRGSKYQSDVQNTRGIIVNGSST